MATSTGPVLPLAEAVNRSASEGGGKAANLALLRNAGFQVLEGFVVTTEAFVRFMTANGFTAGSSPDEVRAGHLPDDVAGELGRITQALGGRVAVRSSGVAEDLKGSSYAGQYESVPGSKAKPKSRLGSCIAGPPPSKTTSSATTRSAVAARRPRWRC